MSSTHKIPALRSLAAKVALGLGIALVASSIAPMAVAPASATGPDVALWSYSVVGSTATLRGSIFGQAETETATFTVPTGRLVR
ncbi:MAG: hypothetical protein RIR34_970, partial [Actinomycetota bacterium]